MEENLQAYQVTLVWNTGVLKSSSVCFPPWWGQQAGHRSVSGDHVESPDSGETKGDSQPREEDRRWGPVAVGQEGAQWQRGPSAVAAAQQAPLVSGP